MITKSKIKSWLTVGACVLLAFTVAGVISNIFAHRPAEPEEEKNMISSPAFYVPIKPGDGLYAKRPETLTFTYDGDYTAGDYNRGFVADSSYVIGGTAENQKWIRTKYEQSNIYLELGKNVLGSPLVHFDRVGTWESAKADTSKVIFEADVKFERPENPELAQGKAQPFFYKFEWNDGKYTGTDASHLILYLYLDGDGYSITDNPSIIPSKVDENALEQVYLSTWVNLRVEFTKSTYTVYLNGRRHSSGVTTVWYLTEYGPSQEPPTRFSIEPRYYAETAVLGLDNVFFGVVNAPAN